MAEFKKSRRLLPLNVDPEQLKYPLEYIKTFFSTEIDLVDAMKSLRMMIRSALSEYQLLSKKEMVSLFGFREHTILVLHVAYEICKNHWDNLPNVKIEAINGDFKLEAKMYCDLRIAECMEWDFFPRYLNRKEFINPYRALRKMFEARGLLEWQLKIEEIFEAAISECSIYACTDEKDPWTLFKYLFKLYEASHLIRIRLLSQ